MPQNEIVLKHIDNTVVISDARIVNAQEKTGQKDSDGKDIYKDKADGSKNVLMSYLSFGKPKYYGYPLDKFIEITGLTEDEIPQIAGKKLVLRETAILSQ